MGATVRVEIELQKRHDYSWGGYGTVLHARIAALLAAQDAVAEREESAGWALRQALVDLAAIAELAAADLPAPPAWDGSTERGAAYDRSRG